MTEDILDCLFHGCAFQAYLLEASLANGPPDREATRKRAYQLYEEAIAERNRIKSEAIRAEQSKPAE